MKNIQSTIFLKGTINKQPGLSRPGIFSKEKMLMIRENLTSIINTVRIFFDMKPAPPVRCSRIRRRTNKSFEEFIFKGYDQQTPGLSRPGSFKDLRLICKN